MTRTERVLHALLWATGAPGELVVEDGDEPLLLEALAEHRLDARLIGRARRDGIRLAPSLEAAVVARDADNLDRVHEQIALFRAVRGRLDQADPRVRLLPMKGFGLYALTGDREHAPFSWDVDVIGADPRAVAAAVEESDGSGYHFHGEEHPYVFAHMDDLEVHMHYVVTSIDRGLRAEDVDVVATTGVFEVRTPFSVSLITHDEMLQHTRAGVGAAAGLEVLAPEMAVLVRLAHLYVGYAMSPQPLPVATIRLEELAQLRDYLALPSFDAARFLELYERHDAWLVTGFARRLMLDLLDVDPFAPIVDAEVPAWFPSNLWWDGSGAGFPLQIPWNAHDLVLCPATHPDLVDVLGPSVVRVPADGGAVTVSMLEADAADAAPRYVHHAYHGGLAGVRVTLREDGDGVDAVATFPPVDDDQMVAVGWASGDYRYEVFFRPAGGTHELEDYSAVPAPEGQRPTVRSCRSGPEGVEIAVRLPWASLAGGQPSGQDATRLLFRGRVQRRPWGEVAGGVVLPLHLTR